MLRDGSSSRSIAKVGSRVARGLVPRLPSVELSAGAGHTGRGHGFAQRPFAGMTSRVGRYLVLSTGRVVIPGFGFACVGRLEPLPVLESSSFGPRIVPAVPSSPM